MRDSSRLEIHASEQDSSLGNMKSGIQSALTVVLSDLLFFKVMSGLIF